MKQKVWWIGWQWWLLWWCCCYCNSAGQENSTTTWRRRSTRQWASWTRCRLRWEQQTAPKPLKVSSRGVLLPLTQTEPCPPLSFSLSLSLSDSLDPSQRAASEAAQAQEEEDLQITLNVLSWRSKKKRKRRSLEHLQSPLTGATIAGTTDNSARKIREKVNN